MSNSLYKPYRILRDTTATYESLQLAGTVDSLYVGRMRYRGGDIVDVAMVGITTDDDDLLFYAVEDESTAGRTPTNWVSLQRVDAHGTTVLVGDPNAIDIVFTK